MITIGLTGNLGSGKTTVARIFAKLGAVVIDADAIVHEQLKSTGKAFAKVVHAFGKNIISNGEIDRRKLADIVFRDPKQLKQLTSIVHPIALKEVRSRINTLKKASKTHIAVIDAPLLIEAGWHRWVDYVIVVKATRELQVKRIMAQRPMKKQEILRRLRMQLPVAQKTNMADIVIDNRKTLQETEKQTRMIVQRLLVRTK